MKPDLGGKSILDLKRLRQHPQELLHAARLRGTDVQTDELLRMDEERRQRLAEAEELKTLRNAAAKKLGAAKKQQKPEAEVSAFTEEVRALGARADQLDLQLAQLDAAIESALLALPNYLHDSVPTDSSKVVHCAGEIRFFPWEPKSCHEIARDLALYDARFQPACALQGLGARLERALTNYCLDACGESGYQEMNGLPLSGLGSDGLSPLSLLRDRIISESELPLRLCTVSMGSPAAENNLPCERYRRFARVELLCAAAPEQADQETGRMLACMEQMLQNLQIPCRTVLLSAAQTAACALRTYSVEVWMPSRNRYETAALISDCGDFQARRDGARYRAHTGGKPQYVFTVAAIGMTIPTLAGALLENHQNEDGSAAVPKALLSYLGTDVIR